MAGYTGIQSDFNPELGFVRRRNHSRYSGEFSWNPLIESSARLRNFVVGTRLDYFESGTTNQIETREAGVDLGMGLEDGGSLDFGLLQTFDRLTDPSRSGKTYRSRKVTTDTSPIRPAFQQTRAENSVETVVWIGGNSGTAVDVH